jgi:DNA-binding beta-propeller fold protein YncE
LSGCTAAGGTFSNADGISLANGYAYIANQGNGTVSVCSVDANGLFSACTASSVGSQPMDVVFSGNYAYVDDAGGNIYLCSVGTGGALSGCIVSDGGSTFPLSAQIAIH